MTDPAVLSISREELEGDLEKIEAALAACPMRMIGLEEARERILRLLERPSPEPQPAQQG